MIGTGATGAPARARMRILLLGRTWSEPAFSIWYDALSSAGVPVDANVLEDGHPPPAVVADSGELLYQAVVQASDGLVDETLESAQRAALMQAERELGLRRITAYAYPGPRYGLRPPYRSGSLTGCTASLTPRGRQLFGYLSGAVPIDADTWGYLAKPASGEDFDTLLTGPDGSSLLGIHRLPDGREQMVQTFDGNPAQAHARLLFEGELAWLTHGVHLGNHCHYLSIQVDDVLLPNHRWDEIRHVSSLERRIRMSGEDAERTANWCRRRRIRLDLVCNGAGGRASRSADHEQPSDPLLDALLVDREAFGWINHTYEHRDLDAASRATIEAEIRRNREWAGDMGIELEPHTVVTGEHTGLANLTAEPQRAENPNLAPALAAEQIRFIGCDASRPYPARGESVDGPRLPPGTPFVTGPALAVPRHPMLLAHDVATETEALDRLRSTSPGRAAPTWADAVAAESRRLLVRVLGNDPRPHYCHQSNLVMSGADGRHDGTSLICQLLDAVLDLYYSLITASAPILQPTMSEIGLILLRRAGWRRVSLSDELEAYLAGREVVIVNRTGGATDLPLTGTNVGDQYGQRRSGWVSVPPGETRIPISGTDSDPRKRPRT
jgi:hypothetical protein